MKLLTNCEAAELLGLKPNTLEIWRWKGCGPTYRKVGRLVRYAESDVLAWLDHHARQNTSQYTANTANLK
jgi:predicted DNA-binding transcriptional regulator AlpA